MSVLTFVFGLIVGTVFGVSTLYFTEIKVDEKKLNEALLEVSTWETQARHWETEAIRAKDNERCAVKMQQYWRARCMNGHFDFKAACDGDGNNPVVVYRDAENDICDGLLMAAVGEDAV